MTIDSAKDLQMKGS